MTTTDKEEWKDLLTKMFYLNTILVIDMVLEKHKHQKCPTIENYFKAFRADGIQNTRSLFVKHLASKYPITNVHSWIEPQ